MASTEHSYMVPLIGCVLMSLLGFYGFYIGGRPVPDDLRVVSGIVSSVEVGRDRRGSIHNIWFTVRGSSGRFSYPGILPRICELDARLKPGTQVRVVYADSDGEADIWGLSIAGAEFIGPEEARAALRKNGYFALALGIVFASGAAYSFWQVKRGRPA
jgi:hypothetical protein